jgi:4-hydroxybenzoate polyprenyltransferase
MSGTSSSQAVTERNASLARRLWIYQAERLPVLRTGILLAAFSAASINVSALLGHRALPGLPTYVLAFAVLFVFFFQLRACDEVKDADEDRRYRPERPIPRGLVSLRLIVGIACAMVPVAVVMTWSLSVWLLAPLAAVWLWLALMTAEFGVPVWLKARPLAYLGSHMLIMPLMDLFVTAAEWLVRDGAPPIGLSLFLGLSFVNGCVLEIGRKLYAPQSERVGVETYTATLGLQTAVNLWIGCLTASLALLAAVGFAVAAPRAVLAVGLFAFAATLALAIRFKASPTAALQKLIDTAAGLWVFVCYMAAGFLPLLVHGSSA